MSNSFAVLGSPIDHSKSPAIHLAAYRVLGEEWSYQKQQVEAGGLKRFVDSAGPEYLGFSVTMPLKENAFNLADVHDKFSLITKSCNTLLKKENSWLGYNTDIFGITQTISAKSLLKIENVVIIGSGATAKSAVVAVSIVSPNAKIKIQARNKVAKKELIAFAHSLGLNTRPSLLFERNLNAADLVISTLPGGAMDSFARKLSSRVAFRPHALLLDVAYSPWPSVLAQTWSDKGATVASGKDMLIWQALAQIRIFKNGSPEAELLNEVAVLEAMRIAAEE